MLSKQDSVIGLIIISILEMRNLSVREIKYFSKSTQLLGGRAHVLPYLPSCWRQVIGWTPRIYNDTIKGMVLKMLTVHGNDRHVERKFKDKLLLAVFDQWGPDFREVDFPKVTKAGLPYPSHLSTQPVSPNLQLVR